jgi:hypothetical protein
MKGLGNKDKVVSEGEVATMSRLGCFRVTNRPLSHPPGRAFNSPFKFI